MILLDYITRFLGKASSIFMFVFIFSNSSIAQNQSSLLQTNNKKLIHQYISWLYYAHGKPELRANVYLNMKKKFACELRNYPTYYQNEYRDVFISDFFSNRCGELDMHIGAVGNIDCYVNDTLYVSVEKPFSCGEDTYYRHGNLPVFNIGDDKFIDSYEEDDSLYQSYKQELAQELTRMNHHFTDTTRYHIKKSYDYSHRRKLISSRHIYEYDNSWGLKKICGCKSKSSKDFIDSMEVVCYRFCRNHGIDKIIFSNIDILDYEEDFKTDFINRFSKLEYPLRVVDGKVVSQYIMQRQYLTKDEIIRYIDEGVADIEGNIHNAGYRVLGVIHNEVSYDMFIACNITSDNVDYILQLKFNLYGIVVSRVIHRNSLLLWNNK